MVRLKTDPVDLSESAFLALHKALDECAQEMKYEIVIEQVDNMT